MEPIPINPVSPENSSVNCANHNSTEDCQPTEILKLQCMFRLHVSDVWKSDECKDLMNYLRLFSSKIVSMQDSPDISQIVDNDKCIEFFRQYIILVTENHSHMLTNTSQRQYINFIKFVMALWNLSDKFDSLCARMATFEVHVYLIRLLGTAIESTLLLTSKQIQLMLMSIVGILHNINNKLQYTRSRYRDEHLVDYLMPLAALDTTKDLISLKTAALLLLAFLVNENENSSLNANDDHIIYILDILKQTLASSNLYSKFYGYHCLEILHSLRNIASPDNNKKSLILNGVLSLITIILKPENEEKYKNEFVAGLELLWSLSFSKQCMEALNSGEHGLKSRVEMLSQSTNQNIVLSARGILWNTNTQRSQSINNLMQNDARTPNANGHIMVSYQHSTQEMMITIKDALLSEGYRVWMDVDHMRGSFVDAMAEGIQHASVLLLGMCQAFKNSPHCRQEVKYAYTLGIPLVPVTIEEGFCPDGWLGLMCATLTYTEFIDPSKFHQSIQQLKIKLGKLGKVCDRSLSSQDSIDGSYPSTNNLPQVKFSQEGLDTLRESISSHHTSMEMATPHIDFITSARSDHSGSLNLFSQGNHRGDHPTMDHSIFRIDSNLSVMDCNICTPNIREIPIQSSRRSQVLDWTLGQCRSWLKANLIDPEQYGYPLTHIDGRLLFELAEMRLTAPMSYFATVREELKLNFIDNLHLSGALRRLDYLC